jgi:hypothetical protein
MIALGSFYVPIFAPISTSSNTAIWVGLGSVIDNCIIQDGVDFQSMGSVGLYAAWYQYAPFNPQYPNSVVVSPNDRMQFWAWEGDSSCGLGPGHSGYGCFFYQDLTTGISTTTIQVTAPSGSGISFQGTTAEAIMEKQNGIALAPWYYASMQLDAADPSWTGGHSFNTDPYKNFTLVNSSGTTLATASYGGSDIAGFVWSNPQ